MTPFLISCLGSSRELILSPTNSCDGVHLWFTSSCMGVLAWRTSGRSLAAVLTNETVQLARGFAACTALSIPRTCISGVGTFAGPACQNKQK